jgi:hypothetical protein
MIPLHRDRIILPSVTSTHSGGCRAEGPAPHRPGFVPYREIPKRVRPWLAQSWTDVASPQFLGERVEVRRWISVLLVCAGVALVSRVAAEAGLSRGKLGHLATLTSFEKALSAPL